MTQSKTIMRTPNELRAGDKVIADGRMIIVNNVVPISPGVVQVYGIRGNGNTAMARIDSLVECVL